MDEDHNVLLTGGTALPAKTSRLALYAAIIGVMTLVVMVVSTLLFSAGFQRLGFYTAFLQLTFPAAIVLGHLAQRKIAANPQRLQGRSLALLGMYLGYFNLIIVAMVIYFIFARTAAPA